MLQFHGFWLHCLWTNTVDRILKQSIVWNPKRPDSQNNRWTFKRRIDRVKEILPNDIDELLVSDEYDVEDVNGENCDSDEEEFWIDIL